MVKELTVSRIDNRRIVFIESLLKRKREISHTVRDFKVGDKVIYFNLWTTKTSDIPIVGGVTEVSTDGGLVVIEIAQPDGSTRKQTFFEKPEQDMSDQRIVNLLIINSKEAEDLQQLRFPSPTPTETSPAT